MNLSRSHVLRPSSRAALHKLGCAVLGVSVRVEAVAMGGAQKEGKGGGKGCPADPQPADQKTQNFWKKKIKGKKKKKLQKKKFWFIFGGRVAGTSSSGLGLGRGERTAFRSVFFG